MVDETYFCDENDAIEMAKIVAKTEGLPVGISSGAALKASIEIARREDMKGKNIVTLFASTTERYLSTGVFK